MFSSSCGDAALLLSPKASGEPQLSLGVRFSWPPHAYIIYLFGILHHRQKITGRSTVESACFTVLHAFWSFPQNTFTALLQLLPVLVLILISVFTQMMATNPPYSLFYKPWVWKTLLLKALQQSPKLPDALELCFVLFLASGPWGWWCPEKRSTWAYNTTWIKALRRSTAELHWRNWRKPLRVTISNTCRAAAGKRNSKVKKQFICFSC